MASLCLSPVCPFIERDHLPALLISRGLGRGRPWPTLWTLSGSVKEGDSVQSGHLTPSHVGTLEVGVEHHVEVEAVLLAGVVDPDVEVELLLPQDDPVADSEVVLPHAVGKVTVRQGEDGLNISAWQPLRSLLKIPFADSAKSMIRRSIHPIVPLTKLRENERNATANRFPPVKHGLFTDKKLFLESHHPHFQHCAIIIKFATNLQTVRRHCVYSQQSSQKCCMSR